ncbi:hypothetical protein INT43_000485 [Umbelopsis isabellina]|uniref:CS domain-containing protein n=1 Tax=Mortierella isabellina TaxID=91625 RepID=A0A8H7Q4L3_MORIS|nr:hypothetical protein INT43_000485 [Umbelopsis isabellina]
MSNVPSDTYKADIAELERLSSLTERESVRSHIDDLLSKLRKQLDRAQEVEKEQELKAIERKRLEAKAQNIYITTGYGWDQSDLSVMLYLNIKDADTLREDQYKLDVQSQSIELNVYNHNGANYNFKISKLAKEVVPDKSRVKLKKAQIVIFLRKSEQGKSWPELRYKSTRDVYNELVRAEDKGETPAVPNAGQTDDIQAKMKEMFQNSDPETRKMMEQTFKQAQSMKDGKFDPLAAMAGMGMGGMGLPGMGGMMGGDILGGHGDHSHGPNCSHQH